MSKESSLKSQSAWLLFAKVVSFVLGALLPFLVARLLTKAQNGEYRLVFQLITNAVAVLPLGFGMSAYYYLARDRERQPFVIFNILVFNLVVGGGACLTLILFPDLISMISQDKEIVRLAPKVGIIVWLWLFSTFLETVAVASQESRLATVFIISAQFSKTVLMVSAVLIFSTVDAFLYAAIIQGAVQTIVLLIYLSRRFPGFWTACDPRFFVEQLIYALPFGLAGLLWTMQTDIHNYFVSHKFSSEEYAVYATGCFDLPLISMLYEAIASVLIPRMSRLQAEDDRPEMIALLARTMQTLAFAYFPVFGFLLITAETFISTLFTDAYLGSVPIFLINILLLPAYIWISDPVIRAYKDLGRLLLIIRVFIFIGLITALYFGIQYLDLRGMIGIVVVTALIDKAISVSLVFWKLKVRWSDAHLLKVIAKNAVVTIVAALLTAVVYYFVRQAIYQFLPHNFVSGVLILGISGTVFSAVYLLSSHWWGIINEEQKAFALGAFGSLRRHPLVQKIFLAGSVSTDLKN